MTVRFGFRFVLSQHILRFNINTGSSNTNPWQDIFNVLPQKFTRGELEQELRRHGVDTNIRQVVYKWRLQNIIKVLEYSSETGHDKAQVFEKC